MAHVLMTVALAALSVGGWGPSLGAPAAERSWLDVESRIQYGYFTEDSRSLNSLSAQISSGGPQDRLKSYYAGLLAYRQALLSLDSNRGQALDQAERCVASLDQALELSREFAEALALQSVCLDMLHSLKPWPTPFSSSRSSALMEKALQLAPKNPRVLLLDAVGDLERSRRSSSDKERTFGKLKKAVAAFEQERQDVDRIPGWGAADAYMFLARGYLDRGDALAARDALERALLIAPDFAQARRLISRITSG
jgi:tetratricopeptide (TPR) repeat protein